MKGKLVTIAIIVILVGIAFCLFVLQYKADLEIKLIAEKNKVEEANYINSVLEPKWIEIISNNLSFSNTATAMVQDKKTKANDKLVRIKNEALKFRSKLEAYAADFQKVTVPNKYKNINDDMIQAIRENIAYYSQIIEICGKPKDAGYTTVRNSANNANEKMFGIYKNMKNDFGVDLKKIVESSQYTIGIDKLASVIKQYRSAPTQVAIFNLTGLSVGSSSSGGSIGYSSDPSRDVLRRFLARYDALRNETQDAVNRARNGDQSAFSELSTGKEKRNQLKIEIAATEVSSQYADIKHNLITVLDYSMSAFDFLSAGSYQEFKNKSAQITEILNRIDMALRN